MSGSQGGDRPENSADDGDDDLLDFLLGKDAPSSEEQIVRAPALGRPRGRDRDPGSAEAIFKEVVARYNADHLKNWPTNTGDCTACRHRGCFGRMPKDPDRWACQSDRHGIDSGGVGVAGDRVWHGDALDLDAHAAGVTPRELLIAQGYLEGPTAAPEIDLWEPSPASSPPEEAGTPRRRFHTVQELGTMPESKAKWVVQGLIPVGAVTIVAGPKAAGKSTLVAAILRAIETGQPFAGFPTEKTTAVYLSEEPASAVVEKCNIFELSGSVFQVRGDFDPTLTFADTMKEAAAEAARRGALLLIVDTWARFSRLKGDGEKDAGTVQAVIEHALAAAAQGLAVVIIQHFRKGAGDADEGDDAGEAIRGSTAFAAAADVLIEIRRMREEGQSACRVLSFVSRYRETPTEEAVLELVGREYRMAGTRESVHLDKARARVLDALREAPEALTRDGIKEATGGKTDSINRAINDLLQEAIVTRSGGGKKGDPYLYSIPEPAMLSPPPLGLPKVEGESIEDIPIPSPLPYRGEGNAEYLTGQAEHQVPAPFSGGGDPPVAPQPRCGKPGTEEDPAHREATGPAAPQADNKIQEIKSDTKAEVEPGDLPQETPAATNPLRPFKAPSYESPRNW